MRSVSPSTDEMCPMNEAGISRMGAEEGRGKSPRRGRLAAEIGEPDGGGHEGRCAAGISHDEGSLDVGAGSHSKASSVKEDDLCQSTEFRPGIHHGGSADSIDVDAAGCSTRTLS